MSGEPSTQKQARVLRIEVGGLLHDWFDVDEIGEFKRSPAFASTLRENIARYFHVAVERQVIYDEDGLLSTPADFSRALQRLHPKLYVYDVSQMDDELREKTVEELQTINQGVAKSWEHFGSITTHPSSSGRAEHVLHMISSSDGLVGDFTMPPKAVASPSDAYQFEQNLLGDKEHSQNGLRQLGTLAKAPCALSHGTAAEQQPIMSARGLRPQLKLLTTQQLEGGSAYPPGTCPERLGSGGAAEVTHAQSGHLPHSVFIETGGSTGQHATGAPRWAPAARHQATVPQVLVHTTSSASNAAPMVQVAPPQLQVAVLWTQPIPGVTSPSMRSPYPPGWSAAGASHPPPPTRVSLGRSTADSQLQPRRALSPLRAASPMALTRPGNASQALLVTPRSAPPASSVVVSRMAVSGSVAAPPLLVAAPRAMRHSLPAARSAAGAFRVSSPIQRAGPSPGHGTVAAYQVFPASTVTRSVLGQAPPRASQSEGFQWGSAVVKR